MLSQNKKDDFAAIYEYNLSTPFDISTKSYTGDSERCILTNGGDDDLNTNTAFGLDFTNDGMKIFVGNGALNGRADGDRVYRFDLTSPYDVSTCSFANNQTSNLDTLPLQDGSNAGDREAAIRKNVLRGIEISNDGKSIAYVVREPIMEDKKSEMIKAEIDKMKKEMEDKEKELKAQVDKEKEMNEGEDHKDKEKKEEKEDEKKKMSEAEDHKDKEVKKEIFSNVYDEFSLWHKDIFFYLCMEESSIWEMVFGDYYKSNTDFETALFESVSLKMDALQIA